MSGSQVGGDESINVLYVNDDEAFAELIRTKLERSAIALTVDTVHDADAAVERLSETAPDCVVTAYSLADGTGIDLVERIETRSEAVPTVLFTGRGSERIASRATGANVSDYIPIRSSENSFEVLGRRIRTLVVEHNTFERIPDDVGLLASAERLLVRDNLFACSGGSGTLEIKECSTGVVSGNVSYDASIDVRAELVVERNHEF